MKTRKTWGWLTAVALLGCCTLANADVIQQEPGADFLVVEAEAFDTIDLYEGDETTGFLLVDNTGTLETLFGSQVLPADTNASGGMAIYDQPGGADFEHAPTWKLQFSTPGLYTAYLRVSMFEEQDDSGYGNEDSVFLPLEINTVPNEQDDARDGWFSFPKLGHDDPLEDPPFWEGQFHWALPPEFQNGNPVEYEIDAGTVLDFSIASRERGGALDAIIFSTDPMLTEEDLDALLEEHGGGGGGGAPMLQAGDSDMDLDFDQLDLVKVQIAAKYLSGQPATWGEGDWNGAPGGSPGNPPAGNNLFDQLDIIAALANGLYLQGPYAAIKPGGTENDGQTSIVYNAGTGELAVDAPAGGALTSVNIDSAAGIFTGDPAQNLGGSFDNDADDNIFKATFGDSFGSLSFGTVAQAGLSEDFVANDLTVVGSLAGGGDLGDVDLIYVPEPSAMILLVMGMFALIGYAGRFR